MRALKSGVGRSRGRAGGGRGRAWEVRQGPGRSGEDRWGGGEVFFPFEWSSNEKRLSKNCTNVIR